MKKIGILGGTQNFERFLHLSADLMKIVRFSNMRDAALAAETDALEALILLPDSSNSLIPTVEWDTFLKLAALKNAGFKLYIENYDSGDYGARGLFGFIADGPIRGFFDEYVVWNGKLLQARTMGYIPGRANKGDIIASVDNCIGSHEPVFPATTSYPLIVRSGNFYYSASALSFFERTTMLPHARWRDLFVEIFSDVLGSEESKVEAAFEEVYPAVSLMGKTPLTQDSLEQAIIRALEWHVDSGIMPDRSGKNGIFEMIRSYDLSVRANHRVDTLVLTSALFLTAGKYFHNDTWTKRGEALYDYAVQKGVQLEDGNNDGLFMWFVESGAGPYTVFCSDNGRDALAITQMYRITGEEKYLNRMKRQADMFLRWMDHEPFFKRTAFDLKDHDIASLPRAEKAPNSPVFYEAPVVALSFLYNLTGEKRYYDAVKRTADAVASAYPDYDTAYSPLTQNFLYSRLLTLLIAAQEIGCGNYSDIINKCIDFFDKLQDTRGGVADFSLVNDELALAHPEFSIGIGKGHDAICDYLYCVNNLLAACAILKTAKNASGIHVEKALKMHKKLIEFVLETQLTDSDNRLNGGWMRAFDLENNEFYGVNRDKDWGPYCIMGGWVMGIIPMLLLSELGAPCLYSVNIE